MGTVFRQSGRIPKKREERKLTDSEANEIQRKKRQAEDSGIRKTPEQVASDLKKFGGPQLQTETEDIPAETLAPVREVDVEQGPIDVFRESLREEVEGRFTREVGDGRVLALTFPIPVGGIAKPTAVDKAAQVGKPFVKTTKTISDYATNAKSVAGTSNFLVKAGLTLGAAGVVTGAIGTYPFSGFLKEEALQTLGLTTKTAIENGDVEGATRAFNEQAAILEPTVWKQIISKIPYANVVSSVNDFYKAAREKLIADRKSIELLQEKEGQTLFEARQEAQRDVKTDKRGL
jgi:hypothetical protein